MVKNIVKNGLECILNTIFSLFWENVGPPLGKIPIFFKASLIAHQASCQV